MKYVIVLLLFALCIMGAVTMGFLIRDNPQYADGEPIAIVKDWLQRQQLVSSTTAFAVGSTDQPTIITENDLANEDQDKTIWMEEYLGNGKWLVSKATLSSGYSKTDLTFEEWIAKTKGWNVTRLTEYVSDLSPEDQEAFQEHMRTYHPGQQPLNILEKWHIYEKSGLVEKIQD